MDETADEQFPDSAPFVGNFLSAAAGAWSKEEQEYVNNVFRQWLQMLQDELREKGAAIVDIMSRLNMKDDTTRARVESDEFQSILKKAFRGWSKIDSQSKREKIRNLLANAAASKTSSDDVVKLFVDWINLYSDFHFEVIGEIYRNQNITRYQLWKNLGRPEVREDSADADLYKLLIRDLSTGSVIRQERATDGYGNFIKKTPSRRTGIPNDNRTKSAFDDEEQYVLTGLGRQFVHYAMNELVPRIQFTQQGTAASDSKNGEHQS
jgi:hypothetical protein